MYAMATLYFWPVRNPPVRRTKEALPWLSMNLRTSINTIAVRDAAETFVELDNGGTYKRYRGTILSAPESLGPGHECQIDLVASPPPAIVATLRNVTVFGRSVIMTEDGKLIQESLINTGQKFGPFERKLDGSFSMAHVPEKKKFLGVKPVVLLKQEWDGNYGHWLIESLPRVEMVMEARDSIGYQYIVGCEVGMIGNVYRDTLQHAGVSAGDILPLADCVIEFDTLVYPTPITIQPWIKAPRAVAYLERLGSSVRPHERGPSKIYVTRRSWMNRRLINEQEIEHRLVRSGYTVVDPGLLDFATQVQMFRDATHIVGILGAALSNYVFAPRGTKLLALTTEYMQDDFYWDLVCQKNGEYTSLHGKATDPKFGMQSDFSIDYEEFLRRLVQFDSSVSSF